MICKVVGVLGPMKKFGDVAEIRCLNWLIRYVEPPYKSSEYGYIERWAEPRHIGILVAAEGLDPSSKGLSTRGVKATKDAYFTSLSDGERFEYRRKSLLKSPPQPQPSVFTTFGG